MPLQSRPRWTHVDRIIQDHESEVFKLYFGDWEDVQTLDDKGICKLALKLGVQLNEGIHMDIDAFFTPRMKRDNSFLLSTLSSFNSLLVKMSVFVHVNGKFITVPAEEIGVLYLKEAYIFLCVYKVIDDAKELEVSYEDKKDANLECVLYFWKGRNTARRGTCICF